MLTSLILMVSQPSIQIAADENVYAYQTSLDSNKELSEIDTPAFPGAEGFGASSQGGRGGRVIEVTNLKNSGPGSLRAAIEAKGPRIVVFRRGGTIELLESLEIENPYITIAGQSATRRRYHYQESSN